MGRPAGPAGRAEDHDPGVPGRAAAAAATGPTLVAEGDSWFDYPPGMDILDNLKIYDGYSIVKLATAGDTLENMVFGTSLNRDFTLVTLELDKALQSVSTHRPKAVLFSEVATTSPETRSRRS